MSITVTTDMKERDWKAGNLGLEKLFQHHSHSRSRSSIPIRQRPVHWVLWQKSAVYRGNGEKPAEFGFLCPLPHCHATVNLDIKHVVQGAEGNRIRNIGAHRRTCPRCKTTYLAPVDGFDLTRVLWPVVQLTEPLVIHDKPSRRCVKRMVQEKELWAVLGRKEMAPAKSNGSEGRSWYREQAALRERLRAEQQQKAPAPAPAPEPQPTAERPAPNREHHYHLPNGAVLVRQSDQVLRIEADGGRFQVDLYVDKWGRLVAEPLTDSLV